MIRLSALCAFSAAALLASVVQAAPIDQAFGNTILSTYPDGRTGELWLQPGGTYTAEGRKGDPSSGKWSMKGEKLCLKQLKPTNSIISFCKAAQTDQLKSGYTTKAVSGETIQVKLVRGRAKGHQGPGS